jgi:hypothetical protein
MRNRKPRARKGAPTKAAVEALAYRLEKLAEEEAKRRLVMIESQLLRAIEAAGLYGHGAQAERVMAAMREEFGTSLKEHVRGLLFDRATKFTDTPAT